MSGRELVAETRQWMHGILARCDALSSRGGQTRAWQIGPTTLRQFWYSEAGFAAFERPLAHLRGAADEAHLTIHCVGPGDGIDLGDAPYRKRDLGYNRAIAALAGSRLRVQWDQDHCYVHALDLDSGRGFYYASDFRLLPEWEPPIPFRNFLHWWAAAEGHVFLHAGSAGLAEGGIVFLGRGGAGKSTTTLACLEAGLVTCGDDYVLVTGGARPEVHTVYGTAKLKNGAAVRPDSLVRRLMPTAQTVAGKTLLFPAIEMPGTFVDHFPLVALAVLDKGGEKTQIDSATPVDALRSAGPSTVLQMPYGQAESLAAIAGLARTLPCFRITLGPNLEEVGSSIANFLRQLVAVTPARKVARA